MNVLVEDFAQKWALDPEEFRYMVASFNPDLENQPGEDALKKSADFEQYKAKTENPVSRLRYWREVKEAYTKMITEDVLPFRGGLGMGRLYPSKEKITQLTVPLTEGEQCLISYLETHLYV